MVFTCLQYRSFENTVGKEEVAPVTSNFSFAHSVFYLSEELSVIFIKFKIVVWKLFEFRRIKKMSFGRGLNLLLPEHFLVILCKKGVNSLPHNFLRKKPFENIVGKGENAGNHHFLLIPQYFLLFPQKSLFFSHNFYVVCKVFRIGLVYDLYTFLKS